MYVECQVCVFERHLLVFDCLSGFVCLARMIETDQFLMHAYA